MQRMPKVCQSICFAMALCGVAASLARAQRLSGAVTAVKTYPEWEAFTGVDTSDPRLSRDGTRVFVVHPVQSPQRTWSVLDTRTGASVASGTTFGDVPRTNAAMSPDGHKVAYVEQTGVSSALHVRDLATGVDTVRLTSTARLAVEAVTDVGTVGYSVDRELLIAAPGAPPFVVQNPCAPPPQGASDMLSGLRFSGDGRYALSSRVWAAPVTLVRGPGPPLSHDTVSVSVDTRTHRCLSTEVSPPLTTFISPASWPTTGTEVLINANSGPVALDTAGRIARVLWPARDPVRLLDVSESGRYLLLHRYTGAGSDLPLLDRVTGVVEIVASAGVDTTISRASLSGDGGTVTYATSRWLPEGPPEFGMHVATLDADGDGIHDGWERVFGLDPSTPADASADADGDGTRNVEEFIRGTHPRATAVRYFAEGAHGKFFATMLGLFNPHDQPVAVNVRFLGPSSRTVSYPVLLPSSGSLHVDIDDVGLPFDEFGIVVEAPAPVIAERRMTWDRSGQYGSHSAGGVDAPSTTWHFAEGATIAGMQTFFLLQNPGDAPATATMRYLLSTGGVQERTHVVPAHARLTVWANQEGAPLDAAEFSTTVVADRPVVTERAMYRDAPGETFAAGSVAAGVTTPASSWFFAEGATGAFFDTYLLLANPNDAPATVHVEFVRAHDVSDVTTALPVTKTYTLAPHSRRTIWVAQEDPGLRDTQVGARMTADLPIVAERTMWWPGPTAVTWRENAAEFGATASGRSWAIADVQADAGEGGWDTFVLVATTEQFLANVRVRVVCDDGTSVTREMSLPVNRTTLWMRYEFPEIVGRRCATTVESLPTRVTLSPEVPLYRTPIVVEKAMYRGDFAAGGVTLATRLPDPP